MNKVENIAFNNQLNPSSRFDVVKIEDILSKQSLSHSPYQFHSIKFYALFIVTDGTGKHYIDFETYDCSKGTVLFIGNGEIHRFEKNTTLKGYLLLFHDDFLSFLNINEITKILQLFNSSLFVPKVLLDEQEFLEIAGRISTIKLEYFKQNDSFSSNIIGGELFTMLSALYRKKSLTTMVTLNTKYLLDSTNKCNF